MVPRPVHWAFGTDGLEGVRGKGDGLSFYTRWVYSSTVWRTRCCCCSLGDGVARSTGTGTDRHKCCISWGPSRRDAGESLRLAASASTPLSSRGSCRPASCSVASHVLLLRDARSTRACPQVSASLSVALGGKCVLGLRPRLGPGLDWLCLQSSNNRSHTHPCDTPRCRSQAYRPC